MMTKAGLTKTECRFLLALRESNGGQSVGGNQSRFVTNMINRGLIKIERGVNGRVYVLTETGKELAGEL